MKVIVKELNGRLFLRDTGIWTQSRPEAKSFGTALEAISFCIHCKARDVRLLGQDENGKDVYLYPFGGDPVAKAERKRLRRMVRENQRLKTEQRTMRVRIDLLLARSEREQEANSISAESGNGGTSGECEPGLEMRTDREG